MKKIILFYFFVTSATIVYAQDYPQYPADKPESGFIEQSQSREIRLKNLILPQEVTMQDKMRVLITNMMLNASKKLGWPVVELSEYTNDNGMQGAGTPYALRSPRGILITFQFIVNTDSLQAWKTYQETYNKLYQNKMQNDYSNVQVAMQSPLYKKYRDSADYYMDLYTNYTQAHQSEGAALYTSDKHPRNYQQKEMDFLNKANAMTQQAQNNSGNEQLENKGKANIRRFRNHTVVQVKFHVNDFKGLALNQSLGPIQFTSEPYAIAGSTISRLYSVSNHQDHNDFDKWNHVILILLGNFQPKPDKYSGYEAAFDQNGQGDEYTPKKIKSDKVQTISINIYGDKNNIEKMAKLIDAEKLDYVLVKN